MGYIDADKLRTLLVERYNTFKIGQHSPFRSGKVESLRETIDLINSLQLELPEVDIRSELEKYIFPISVETMKKEPFTQLEKCAHYFYNLGLNTRKEE